MERKHVGKWEKGEWILIEVKKEILKRQIGGTFPKWGLSTIPGTFTKPREFASLLK